MELDVTNDSDIEHVFKQALDKFGRVDVVVTNAGYGLSGVFEELTPEQIKTQMEVNFSGLLQVTRKAMEVMREQKPSGGLIQQVTSIGGREGMSHEPTGFLIKDHANNTQCSNVQQLLRLEMGRGRVHRGDVEGGEA